MFRWGKFQTIQIIYFYLNRYCLTEYKKHELDDTKSNAI